MSGNSLRQRVYLDTNIIMILGLFSPSNKVEKINDKLNQFLDYEIIVSLWSIIEAYGALWRKYSQNEIDKNNQIYVESTNKRSEFTQTINKYTKTAMDQIMNKLKDKNIKVKVKKEGLRIPFKNIYDEIKEGFTGSGMYIQYGELAQSSFPGAPDLLHLQIAEIMKCNNFITDDNGFHNVNESEKIFSGTIVTIN